MVKKIPHSRNVKLPSAVISVVQCVYRKKEPKWFFCKIFRWNGWFWWNLIRSFQNKFGAKSLHVVHLTWVVSNVSTLPCKTWNAHRARDTVELSQRETPEFVPTVAFEFARFESSWLQRVGAIARKGVQNTHHWSGRTETATENDSHSSVASSIAPDQWCDLATCLAGGCWIVGK